MLGLLDSLTAYAPARVLPCLADLWALLGDPRLDMARLVEATGARRMADLLWLALEFLSGLADGTPIQPQISSALAALPPSPRGAAVCAVLKRSATRWNRMLLRWQCFRLGQENVVTAALRFPRHIQYTLGEPNLLSVGRHVLRRR